MFHISSLKVQCENEREFEAKCREKGFNLDNIVTRDRMKILLNPKIIEELVSQTIKFKKTYYHDI